MYYIEYINLKNTILFLLYILTTNSTIATITTSKGIIKEKQQEVRKQNTNERKLTIIKKIRKIFNQKLKQKC